MRVQEILEAAGESSRCTRDEPVRDIDDEKIDAQIAASLFQEEEQVRIGRFVVLRRLGSGGMGIVYSAYDDTLNRKVAVKVVRGVADASHRQRLRSEAQAQAKVKHLNVVMVYESGEHHGQVFVAMEFVDGQNLAEWHSSAGKQAGWREILDIYIAAGQGLAAAHQAGLVHRDFKPANVLIDRDGAVKVTDFGLARLGDRGAAGPDMAGWGAELSEAAMPSPPTGRSGRELGSDGLLGARLTRTGTLVGTLAYMAPEVLAQATAENRAVSTVTPLSDQFAFCVALWEAVFGERPFAGETLDELAVNVTDERRRQPPISKVPSWLRRIVARGLSVNPAHRWPSLEAMLSAIDRGLRWMRRVRQGLLLILAGAVATAGVLGWRHLEHAERAYERSKRIAACRAAGAEITDVWNEESKAALRQAFVATGTSYAASTYEKMVPWVDRWSQDWSAVRERVCREADIEGVRPQESLELAESCLHDRRDALAGLLAVLADGGPSAVERAVPAVASLSRSALCSEQSFLERYARLGGPTVQTDVAVLRHEIIRNQGYLPAGQYAVGFERTQPLLAKARELGYRPLEAEAGLLLGSLAWRAGMADVAEQILSQAFVDAGATENDEIAARAAAQQIYVVGNVAARPAEALVWGRAAEMLVDRLEQDEGLLGAEYRNGLAEAYRTAGNLDAALATHQHSLNIREAVLGEDHPLVAGSLNNVAIVQTMRGDYSSALRTHLHALAIFERVLGNEHPTIAASLNNIGIVHRARGDLREAAVFHANALAMAERTFGPEHPKVAENLGNLAVVEHELGDNEHAEERQRRALAFWERTSGAMHPDVAVALINLGNILHAQHRYVDALALHQRALGIYETSFGLTHVDVGMALNNVGTALHALGEHEEAESVHRRALAIRESTLGGEHPDVAMSLHNLAEVLLSRGQYEAAHRLSLRALEIKTKSLDVGHRSLASIRITIGETALLRGLPAEAERYLEEALGLLAHAKPDELSRVRFSLARALWGTSRRGSPERRRALALAEQAADAHRAMADSQRAELTRIERWLRTHTS